LNKSSQAPDSFTAQKAEKDSSNRTTLEGEDVHKGARAAAQKKNKKKKKKKNLHLQRAHEARPQRRERLGGGSRIHEKKTKPTKAPKKAGYDPAQDPVRTDPCQRTRLKSYRQKGLRFRGRTNAAVVRIWFIVTCLRGPPEGGNIYLLAWKDTGVREAAPRQFEGNRPLEEGVILTRLWRSSLKGQAGVRRQKTCFMGDNDRPGRAYGAMGKGGHLLTGVRQRRSEQSINLL